VTEIPDFDALYRAEPDPWSVRTSPYEQRKLSIIMACLNRPHYEAAWDPTCGVGELAFQLADRAAHVLATDASAEAVALTRQRCADRTGVEVAQLRLPLPPPCSDLDLIVLSEFCYYLEAADRRSMMTMINSVAAGNGEVLSVHWRFKPHDGWLSGESVQREIAGGLRRSGWTQTTHHLDTNFILDVHRRSPA
jgi:SAM-dependent methyltransferase